MGTEELGSELQKLKINPSHAPLRQLMHCNIPSLLNPFYKIESSDSLHLQDEKSAILYPHAQHSQHKQKRCWRRCRPRHNSESVADDLKNGGNNIVDTTNMEKLSVVRDVPGVQRCSFKKTNAVTSGKRRTVLSPPVLDALHNKFNIQSQTCYRRSLERSLDNEECILGNDTGQKTDSLHKKNDIYDFRDLIVGCESLLLRNADFNQQFKKMNINLRNNSKIFTTIQKSKETNSNTKSNNGCDSNSSIDNKHIVSINSITTRTTSPSRASTSCSQQAGNGANTTGSTAIDDVTVDELASYFDTFVHIPKKMSQMAEMMYI
ncbi:uncharacterized protein LOC119689887 [Teleopsis dalmanni]|uniref:uncharacterized protein LOC119689887 n=1 Tax=Teleopsis dalmanni TaxID=139649 RepID=UPI0018CFBFE0|nr:uncharacterized protein LOC119689887 [Teleopsis dalmanni]